MNAEMPEVEPMLEKVASRTLFNAPAKIRQDLLHVQARRPAHHIVVNDFYVLFALTSALRVREVNRRRDIYGSPFPGLVTASPDGKVFIVVADGGRIHLQGIQVKGFDYCVRLQRDANIILEEFSYRPSYIKNTIRLNLAYAISFGDKVAPENVHEYMEDLFIYHIHNYRQLRQSADDEKRRLSAPS